MTMRDYQGKLVLLTGASAGLGRDLALVFHEAGAKVALVARRREPLEALARELGPERAKIFPADLSELAAIPALVENVAREFAAPVDVLVHNAGASVYGEVERTPFSEIERIVRLNYLAGIRLTQCVLEPMKRRRSGQIVWIGSGSAFRGIPRAAAYSSSKAAAKGFCEALAGEVGADGVDVLYVAPGALETRFHESQANYSASPLRRTGAPAPTGPLAREILKAARKGGGCLVLGRNVRIGRHLAYWAPGLLDWLIRRQL